MGGAFSHRREDPRFKDARMQILGKRPNPTRKYRVPNSEIYLVLTLVVKHKRKIILQEIQVLYERDNDENTWYRAFYEGSAETLNEYQWKRLATCLNWEEGKIPEVNKIRAGCGFLNDEKQDLKQRRILLKQGVQSAHKKALPSTYYVFFMGDPEAWSKVTDVNQLIVSLANETNPKKAIELRNAVDFIRTDLPLPWQKDSVVPTFFSNRPARMEREEIPEETVKKPPPNWSIPPSYTPPPGPQGTPQRWSSARDLEIWPPSSVTKKQEEGTYAILEKDYSTSQGDL